jgi:hypothetical protein
MVSIPATREDIEQMRIEAYRLVVVANRFVEIAVVVMRIATTFVVIGIIWFKSDRLTVVANRFGEVASTNVGFTSIRVDDGSIWFEPEGLTVIRDGLVKLPWE